MRVCVKCCPTPNKFHTDKLTDTKFWLYTKVELMAELLSHDDGEFESCQLCGHEQRLLLDEIAQSAATVLCQSTAVPRTLNFIGIV